MCTALRAASMAGPEVSVPQRGRGRLGRLGKDRARGRGGRPRIQLSGCQVREGAVGHRQAAAVGGGDAGAEGKRAHRKLAGVSDRRATGGRPGRQLWPSYGTGWGERPRQRSRRRREGVLVCDTSWRPGAHACSSWRGRTRLPALTRESRAPEAAKPSHTGVPAPPHASKCTHFWAGKVNSNASPRRRARMPGSRSPCPPHRHPPQEVRPPARNPGSAAPPSASLGCEGSNVKVTHRGLPSQPRPRPTLLSSCELPPPPIRSSEHPDFKQEVQGRKASQPGLPYPHPDCRARTARL